MSAQIREDAFGVQLDYGDAGAKHPYHDDSRVRPSDFSRYVLLDGQRAFQRIRLMFECLEVNAMAMARVDDSLARIEKALALRASEYGS